MMLKTIGEVIDVLKSWALGHIEDIKELILVGGQANIKENDSPPKKSDVDLVIVIRDGANSMALLSDLATVGLRHSILFHPLVMASNELQKKLLMKHYREMFHSGKCIYPENKSLTRHIDNLQ